MQTDANDGSSEYHEQLDFLNKSLEKMYGDGSHDNLMTFQTPAPHTSVFD